MPAIIPSKSWPTRSQGREEEAFDKKYIGAFEGKIVGVNHYRGHVNNREMVRID